MFITPVLQSEIIEKTPPPLIREKHVLGVTLNQIGVNMLKEEVVTYALDSAFENLEIQKK